ncbi:RidA family protein [Mucilaginibacter sp. 14171R-50]|uniref:RidA family protein n=1 Tax=Mucilaginibacter sp. 14171R-50 TaxID=2703789 RepID=UPI00138DC440|nr:RidA family protein [Mucilaginibacter sp. 14171R-50]QHS54146.1 RidA family protein [Mucilaginibacter sp. 14171R-50]
MKKFLHLVLLCISANCLAQAPLMQQRTVTFKNPPGLSTPKGYSHLAEVDLGKSKMLILSGQVALNEKGELVGKEDVGKQSEQVFANIKHIVEAAGGTMGDVIKLTYYLKDVSKIQAVRDARDKYINIQTPPASTLVEVSKLFRDDILIEIEATAIIEKK